MHSDPRNANPPLTTAAISAAPGSNAAPITPNNAADGSTATVVQDPAPTVAPAQPSDDAGAGFAFANPLSHARFWGVAVAGVALDLWSKEWAFHTVRQGGHWVIIPYVLEFQTLFNAGALFGIGRGQTTLFLTASVAALALVLWMFAQSSPRRRLLHIALGGILAGALGNMYDRMFVRLVERHRTVDGRMVTHYVQTEQPDGTRWLTEYPPTAANPHRMRAAEALPEYGYVRDFLKIPTKIGSYYGWPWVFNVADMLLVGGVSILAVYLWAERKPPAPAANPPTGNA